MTQSEDDMPPKNNSIYLFNKSLIYEFIFATILIPKVISAYERVESLLKSVMATHYKLHIHS